MDYVEIKTVDDIFKYVNKDNWQYFLKDFNLWVKINVMAKIDGFTPVTDTFNWKDDGKHKVDVILTVEGLQNETV